MYILLCVEHKDVGNFVNVKIQLSLFNAFIVFKFYMRRTHLVFFLVSTPLWNHNRFPVMSLACECLSTTNWL